MKKGVLLIVALLALNFSSHGQGEQLNTGMGFGYQLVQYQRDFGFGVNLTSPYFAGDHIGIRLKANLMYNQNVADTTTQWIPYGNVSLGVIGVGGQISDRIRVYGEGGVMAILPSSKIDSDDLIIGGYGLFGFEFFFSHFGNLFIEVGGIGAGAVADKVNTRPIYSNGMSLSAGCRFFLK